MTDEKTQKLMKLMNIEQDTIENIKHTTEKCLRDFDALSPEERVRDFGRYMAAESALLHIRQKALCFSKEKMAEMVGNPIIDAVISALAGFTVLGVNQGWMKPEDAE